MHDDPHLIAGPRLDPGTISPAGRLVRFHGGRPKAPKPSNKESLLSAQNDKALALLLSQSMKPMEVPQVELPPPTPPPSPPPTMSNADVVAASKQMKKQVGKRKGIKSTLLSPANQPTAGTTGMATSTLLG